MRFPFFRRHQLTEEPKNAVSRSDDTYKTRSRCSSCKEFVIEGTEHTCPITEQTKTHQNPAAPRPKPEDRK